MWIFLHQQLQCVEIFGFVDWHFSSDLGNFFSHYVFEYYVMNIFHVPFSLSNAGTPIIHMLMCLMVLNTSLRRCLLSFFLFFSSPYCIIFINLSLVFLILFSASSNLLLSPSSNFFILITIIFNSRLSTWFLLIISISLLIFFYLMRHSYL